MLCNTLYSGPNLSLQLFALGEAAVGGTPRNSTSALSCIVTPSHLWLLRSWNMESPNWDVLWRSSENHPEIHLFGTRIILSWLHLRNSSHRELCALPFCQKLAYTSSYEIVPSPLAHPWRMKTTLAPETEGEQGDGSVQINLTIRTLIFHLSPPYIYLPTIYHV